MISSAVAALAVCLISLAAAGLVGYSRLATTVAVLKTQIEPCTSWAERLARIEETTKWIQARLQHGVPAKGIL